MIGAVIDCGG
jgi:hypothetical protein